MENNTQDKVIKIGDLIMVFQGGNKKTISKQQTPELFNKVCSLLLKKEEKKAIDTIFGIEKTISQNFSGKLKIENQKVYYDNIEIPSVFGKKIIELCYSENNNFEPIIRFFEKLNLRQTKKNLENDDMLGFSSFIFKEDNVDIHITSLGNIIIRCFDNIIIEPDMCDGNSKTMQGLSKEHSANISLFVVNTDVFVDFDLTKETHKKENNLKEPLRNAYFLFSPIDFFRISIGQKNILFKNTFNDEQVLTIHKIIVKRTRKVLDDELNTDSTFVYIKNEDLYDMSFEFQKELNEQKQ